MWLQVEDASELRDRVRALVAMRVAQPADADDITQDVLERVLRRRAQLRDAERADAWLARIVRNAVVDHHRQRRLPAPADPAVLDAVAVGDDDRPSASGRLAPCVQPLVDSLPPPYAEALRLTDLGTHTQEDAAARLGLSASGMKSRVQRGRRLLEAALHGCCTVERDTRGALTDIAPQPRSRCGASAPCLDDSGR
ncbi:MAG TPA: sigma-70 family RNA polymerase sigma factor [Gemmatimonadaceae bacterium]|nr:sigma-70 family RNA polymerase sigma factor [Gemmatimonadaceae bacterium]